MGLAWGRDPISTFWDPLNISQTGKATIFKFGTHIGKHVGLRSAGAGEYCGGHLATQLVTFQVIEILVPEHTDINIDVEFSRDRETWCGARCTKSCYFK